MSECITNKIQKLQTEKVFITDEATMGINVLPTTSDFLPTLTAEAERDDNQRLKKTKTGSPTNFYMENGQTSGSFDISAYFQPSGIAGQPPLIKKLLNKYFDEQNGGSYVDYKLKNDLSGTITTHRFLQNVKQLWLGSAPTKFEFSAPDFLMAKISGLCQEIKTVGQTTASAGVSAGIAIIPVNKPYQLSKGAYIKIGSEDNGGSGYKITDIDYTGSQITISPVLVNPILLDDLITYFDIDIPSISDNILNFMKGSWLINAVNYNIQNMTISIDSKIDFIKDAYGEETPQCFYDGGNREVVVSFDIILKKDYVDTFVNMIQAEQNHILEFTFGTEAGKIIKFTMPNVKFKTPKVPGGEEGLVVLPLSGTALGTVLTGNDEISIRFE